MAEKIPVVGDVVAVCEDDGGIVNNMVVGVKKKTIVTVLHSSDQLPYDPIYFQRGTWHWIEDEYVTAEEYENFCNCAKEDINSFKFLAKMEKMPATFGIGKNRLDELLRKEKELDKILDKIKGLI